VNLDERLAAIPQMRDAKVYQNRLAETGFFFNRFDMPFGR
jgi:hypothetical protein